MYLWKDKNLGTAQKTQLALDTLGWTVLPHPPYSPDLAPSDFFLFPEMKDYLRGRRFVSRSALGSSVFQWMKANCTQQRLTQGIRLLPSRWKKCIAAGGEYFEK